MAIDTKLYQNKVKQNLWANNKYNIFYYSFIISGKKKRGLIDLTNKRGLTKKDRMIYAEKELLEIKNNAKEVIVDDIILDEYLKTHFKFHKENAILKDKKSFYARYMKKELGHRALKDIRPLHVREVLKGVEDAGLSPRSKVRVLEILRPLYKEAIANRIVSYNPVASISIKLPPTKKMVSNATEELAKIHKAIVDEFHDNPFYKALFLFALQGRRKNEVLSLKWEDINFDKNFYILRKTKGNEEQRMHLPKDIQDLLLEFKDDSWEYVFTSAITGTRLVDAKRAVARLKKRTGNQKFGLHYLRNVITSAMAEQGLDSIFLSGALGHNDPNTIKKYLTMNYLKSSEKASEIINTITTIKPEHSPLEQE